jgi:hypothetical protein
MEESVDRAAAVVTRQVQQQLDVRHVSCWKAVHKQSLHLSHLQSVRVVIAVYFPAQEDVLPVFAQGSANLT